MTITTTHPGPRQKPKPKAPAAQGGFWHRRFHAIGTRIAQIDAAMTSVVGILPADAARWAATKQQAKMLVQFDPTNRSAGWKERFLREHKAVAALETELGQWAAFVQEPKASSTSSSSSTSTSAKGPMQQHPLHRAPTAPSTASSSSSTLTRATAETKNETDPTKTSTS